MGPNQQQRKSNSSNWTVTDTAWEDASSLPFFYPFNDGSRASAVNSELGSTSARSASTRWCRVPDHDAFTAAEVGPTGSCGADGDHGDRSNEVVGDAINLANIQYRGNLASPATAQDSEESKTKKTQKTDRRVQKKLKTENRRECRKRNDGMDWRKIRKDLKETIYTLDENELILLYRLYQAKYDSYVPKLCIKSYNNLVELFWREASGTPLSVCRLFNLMHVMRKIMSEKTKEEEEVESNSRPNCSRGPQSTSSKSDSTDYCECLPSNKKCHQVSEKVDSKNSCTVS